MGVACRNEETREDVGVWDGFIGAGNCMCCGTGNGEYWREFIPKGDATIENGDEFEATDPPGRMAGTGMMVGIIAAGC